MLTLPHSITRQSLIAAGVLLLGSTATFAASGTGYWNGTDTSKNATGGTGIWDNTTSNWKNQSDGSGTNKTWGTGTGNSVGPDADFKFSPGTVTLGNNITASSLTFEVDGYVIPFSASYIITLSGINTISTATGTTTIGATMTGTTWSKTGSGQLNLTGANSFTGAATVAGGVLAVSTFANGGVASGLGQSSNAAANLVLNGGTVLYIGAGVANTDRNFTLISTSGGFDVDAAAGALNFTGTGPIALGGVANGTHTLTLAASNVATNNFALSIGDNGSGATSVQKTGTGTWALSASNAYSGTTLVSGGTLAVTGSIANSATTVQSGGTLAGTGTVGGVTLNSGAFLAPGSAASQTGTLTASSLTWNGGTLQFNLGAIAANSDRLALTGAMSKGTGGTFLFDFLSSGTAGQTYTLITAGSGGLSAFAPSNFSYTNLADGLTGQFSITGDNLNFAVSAVPEPATYGLLGAGLLAGIAFVRRRQKK